MNSPETLNKSYWTDEIKKLRNRIEELSSFIADSQNSFTPEGEDASDAIGDAEIELLQLKMNLIHARTELVRIEQQEEIAALLPQIEDARMKVAHRLSQSDAEEARVFREIQERLEARVRELQQDPVLDEEE